MQLPSIIVILFPLGVSIVIAFRILVVSVLGRWWEWSERKCVAKKSEIIDLTTRSISYITKDERTGTHK